jgi:hypothetical protein
MERNSPMTSRKTALSLAGGALLVTYFAAANMPSQDADRSRERARPAESLSTATLADEVHSQAARLQARMAQAPTPEHSSRNPFAFGQAPRAPRGARADLSATVAVDAAMPVVLPPPMLTLMGIAEESIIGGVRRTAVIALQQGQGDPGMGGSDPILMVREGEPVGDRYTVIRISVDAVELEDVLTKAYRRIALR